MVDELKFLEIRKNHKILANNDHVTIFKQNLRDSFFLPLCNKDSRLKYKKVIFLQVCEISLALSAEEKPTEISTKICKTLFMFVVSLLNRKREAGQEKSISIKKSQQFTAFNKVKKNIGQFILKLSENGDPLLQTQQLIELSKKFTEQVDSMFLHIEDIQSIQRNYPSILQNLSDLIGFEMAEKALNSIYNEIAKLSFTVTDCDRELTQHIEAYLPLKKSTFENNFRNYKKTNGLKLKKSGRPKKN